MLFPPNASDLLARIPLSARTVLEVRCGTGTLAAAYRAMNPTARLLGIESDPSAAVVAAAHLDQVSSVDPETDPLPFDVPEGIDCIGVSHVGTENQRLPRTKALRDVFRGSDLVVLPHVHAVGQGRFEGLNATE